MPSFPSHERSCFRTGDGLTDLPFLCRLFQFSHDVSHTDPVILPPSISITDVGSFQLQRDSLACEV